MALSTQQQKNLEAWQASGLMQAAYCRQHKGTVGKLHVN